MEKLANLTEQQHQKQSQSYTGLSEKSRQQMFQIITGLGRHSITTSTSGRWRWTIVNSNIYI